MDTQQNILQKNISAIQNYNEQLGQKIYNITKLTYDIELCQTNLQEPNISFNKFFIHNPNGAQKESLKVVKSINFANDTNAIHVIFGLGLGYLLSDAYEYLKGYIVLYEPNLEILRSVLEIVELSSILEDKRVMLVSNEQELQNAFYSYFKQDCNVTFSFLDSYKNIFKDDYEKIFNEVQNTYSIYDYNFKFTTKKIFHFFVQTLTHLNKKKNLPLLNRYKGCLQNLPAVIVSAGPSLSNNIEILKQYRKNVVIFCVGTAVKTLIKHDIEPDFLNIIESNNCKDQLINIDLSRINLITETYANKFFYELQPKRHFLTASIETPSNDWFLDITQKNRSLAHFETKGTVSYQALYSAFLLGCNPIILLGQDLAYTNGKLYAQDSIYGNLRYTQDPLSPQGLKFEFNKTNILSVDKILQSKIDKMKKSLTFVKGQQGDILPTETAYALFIQYLQDFAKNYGHNLNLINASSAGAQIDGFHNINLKSAIENLQNIDNIVDSSFENYTSLQTNFNSQKFIHDIKDMIQILYRVSNIISQSCTYFQSYKKEISRAKILNDSGFKALQKFLNNSIVELQQIAKVKQYQFLKYIFIKPDKDLTDAIKDNIDKKDFHSQKKIIEAIEIYLQTTQKQILQVLQLLKLI